MPSTSTAIFSPEQIRPFPKAPPRKISNIGRKTRKSAIYTDTPEKEAIRNEYEEKLKRYKAKQAKKGFDDSEKSEEKNKGKKKAKTTKKKMINTLSPESLKNEEYCLVCMAPYSESEPGEEWFEWSGCKFWSHEDCTEGSLNYVCHNCK